MGDHSKSDSRAPRHQRGRESRDQRIENRRANDSRERRDLNNRTLSNREHHRENRAKHENDDFQSSSTRHSRYEPRALPSNITEEIPSKKFTTRCRLFLGNLSNEITEEELRKLVTEFGEVSECFMSGKGFAFVRLDTRAHAESAKESLDGKTIHGRQLRVRFASHGACIRVWEVPPMISNEVLYNTFSIFGDVERAIHIVDERGKPTGEGIIEFERKAAAQEALREIENRVFVLNSNSRPLRAEILENRDEEDGLSERMIQRTNSNFKDREIAPRFASEKSFEFSYGMRWKELYQFEKSRREQLEAEFRDRRQQLELELEVAYEDFQAEKLRAELEQRKLELERLEARKGERVRQVPRQQYEDGQWMNGAHMYDERPPQHFIPMTDGPHGRSSTTHGRDPTSSYYNKNERNSRDRPSEHHDLNPDVMNLVQPFPKDNEQHHLGVQRSLNQSLGFPQDPTMFIPPLSFAAADSFGAFNPPFAPSTFPPVIPNIMMPPNFGVPPPDKRQRR
ncbi:hypothetical protein M3Y95_00176000 [Aphelenchoides besseyi]|nr:hypothetical protein M3Y95_00176000 [Aphelenchoides besseyi]